MTYRQQAEREDREREAEATKAKIITDKHREMAKKRRAKTEARLAADSEARQAMSRQKPPPAAFSSQPPAAARRGCRGCAHDTAQEEAPGDGDLPPEFGDLEALLGMEDSQRNPSEFTSFGEDGGDPPPPPQAEVSTEVAPCLVPTSGTKEERYTTTTATTTTTTTTVDPKCKGEVPTAPPIASMEEVYTWHSPTKAYVPKTRLRMD